MSNSKLKRMAKRCSKKEKGVKKDPTINWGAGLVKQLISST
jgi:hypothetical protein